MKYYDGVHLVADSLDELHQWCAKVGIKCCWFHCARTHPHYDIVGKNKSVIQHYLNNKQVIKVDSKFLLLKSKNLL